LNEKHWFLVSASGAPKILGFYGFASVAFYAAVTLFRKEHPGARSTYIGDETEQEALKNITALQSPVFAPAL
jgi:hypothetical protein